MRFFQRARRFLVPLCRLCARARHPVTHTSATYASVTHASDPPTLSIHPRFRSTHASHPPTLPAPDGLRGCARALGRRCGSFLEDLASMDVSVVVPLLIEKIALARRKNGAAALIGAQVCRHTPLPGVPRRAQACPGVPGRAHTRHCLDCPGEPTRPGVEVLLELLRLRRSQPAAAAAAAAPAVLRPLWPA